ncbi:exonuclease 1 [Bicyclus anynana]|uniref:Exonuclease 1 n=1 Tax=Bicyclus anynana TaxID=110368 RepID=A0A6J1NGW6_BICAN|nr:exonuclease 1 [Bicyclus anynana]
MGITGLIPFLEKASRRANVSEFAGCTVAIDTYCWLHKGAFACADKLVRGEETDVHIKYCLKYVTMLLSKNIKPILVFDGRHLPAKAMTEMKRRESRDISKKRAAELLSLGKIDEARSFMRRSVDITHAMALALIKECRQRNVDCIVAPYEADAQLAYLNVKNYAQLVITEDSDLILFGCTKVLFKMDLDGTGTLVETAKLPLVMKCPIEHYRFDKFRRMCIMSGCDYLASLPGIGLVKARQFVTATQDSDFANALRKLPGFFNRSNLTVTDEYRENFLKAEATFKHQFVYDPIERKMLRLTEPDDEDIELALCVNAGELLEPAVAFQLALGNIEPFTLKKLDHWDPDHRDVTNEKDIKTSSWKDKGIANHPSIWSSSFTQYLSEDKPWMKKVKKVEPIISVPQTRLKKKVVTLVSKYVPETQDESLSIETLTSMYCKEPSVKKQKIDSETDTQYIETFTQDVHNIASTEIEITKNVKQKNKSPILQNRQRSFKKYLENRSDSIMKKLSRFPRTVLDDNIIESKFFNEPKDLDSKVENCVTIEESPEKCVQILEVDKKSIVDCKLHIDTQCTDSLLENSQKENSPNMSQKSPILDSSPKNRNPFKVRSNSDVSSLDNKSLSPNKSEKNPILESIPNNRSPSNSEDSLLQCNEQNSLIPNMTQNSPLESSQKTRNPFKLKSNCSENDSVLVDSEKYSPKMSQKSPILGVQPQSSYDTGYSESIIENTCPYEDMVVPVDPEITKSLYFNESPSPPKVSSQPCLDKFKQGAKKPTCRVPGLRKVTPLPTNQPTLLSKFGFQKRTVLKK